MLALSHESARRQFGKLAPKSLIWIVVNLVGAAGFAANAGSLGRHGAREFGGRFPVPRSARGRFQFERRFLKLASARMKNPAHPKKLVDANLKRTLG